MRAEIAVGTAVIACLLAANRGPLAAQQESPPRQVVSDRSPVRTNSTFLSRFRPQTKSFQRGERTISLTVTNLPVLDRDYQKVSELQAGQLLKLERATAIKLKTEIPLRFGKTEIPIWNVAENYPGVYSLWLKKVDDGWRLVFNDEADAWGTQHDAAYDRAEIPIAYRRLETDSEANVELNGAIEGSPDSLSGTLRVSWGEHQWTADLEFVDNGSQRPHAYDLESNYLRWPLPRGEESYGRIDGDRLKKWVNDMTAISRRNRASGSQYWGRIAGTPSDQETEAWITAEFERLGLEGVHSQPFTLSPQWFPTSWQVSIAGEGAGQSGFDLTSAHPAKGSAATPEEGLDLEAVWVGLGTGADLEGRNLKGKAAIIYSMPTPSVIRHSAQWNGAAERAGQAGAAAVFIALGIPGGFTTQLNSTYGANVPTFSLSMEDGDRIRETIETRGSARIHLRLETEIREGLECANIWGSLPGRTDENVIVIAHHDGYFEGALDNASGTAVMLGLAEHFASLPRESRRRTIHFVSTAGHHAGSLGTRWMHDQRDTVLAETALMLNSEHVSVTQTYTWGPRLRRSNTVDARRWWVNGSAKLKSIVLDAYSTFGVSVYHEMEPTASGDMGAVCRDLPSVQIIESPAFYHSDQDLPAHVPAVGLEAMARSFAKILTEIDSLDRHELE